MERARSVVGLKFVVWLEVRAGAGLGMLEVSGEALETAESCGIGVP